VVVRLTRTRIRWTFREYLLNRKKEIDSLGPVKHESSTRIEWQEQAEKEDVERANHTEVAGDKAMVTNQDLTDALRRTAQTLQEELEKSVLATQILESSTATMRSSTLQQEVLDTVMDTSRQLVKALESADWLDRVLILAALLFFVLVILFILKQRVVDRGVRLVFWWTRFIPGLGSPGSPRGAVPTPTEIRGSMDGDL